MRLTTREHAPSAGPAPAPSALSPLQGWLVIAVLLTLTFLLDRATDAAPVQHLYYVAIIVAGVRFRTLGAVLTALTATVLYHVANPHLLTFRYEESYLIQIVLFLAVGLVTARLTFDTTRLRLLAMTDDLTGLHNLRSFEVRLARMARASAESGLPLTLFVLDVDRLKSLNDTHGHLAGAEAVRAVGHLIAARLPAGAVGCRYGGDEFVAALPGCPASRGRAIADDLRRAVHASAPTLAGLRFPAGTLSVSIGLASSSFGDAGRMDSDWSGRALFRAADTALYQAKARGRNTVSVAIERPGFPEVPAVPGASGASGMDDDHAAEPARDAAGDR